MQSMQSVSTLNSLVRSSTKLCIPVAVATVLAQTAIAAEDTQSQFVVEEIIVTAQKREQRAQDVPFAITAISGADLVDNSQARMQDYFRDVPGLSLTSRGSGQNTLSLRGLTTGSSSNPTVGIVIDDVPYGSTLYSGFGNILLPDLDPSDLQRIEVLKGPQGTLYGANSIGGLLKYVTADPSTERFFGRFGAEANQVDGDDTGYAARGSVNIPLGDAFAIRANGFFRRDPGYIDDPVRGRKDLNDGELFGGGLGALWNISSNATLKLKGMYQHTEGDGSNQIDTDYLLRPRFGEYGQSRVPNTGQYETSAQIYSANLTVDLGHDLTLTSISGYNSNRFDTTTDLSATLGGLSQLIFGVTGSALPLDFKTNKFTQELRLAQTGAVLDWQIGGFYTKERTRGALNYNSNDFTTGAFVGQMLLERDALRFREQAIFGDVTFHVTDRFDIQAGGRYIEDQTHGSVNQSGLLGNLAVVADSDTDASTFLVSPSFHFTPDLMAYARVSSGYRPGGPNAGVTTTAVVPATYDSDETLNYELGVKSVALDGRVSFDLSGYYVDWKDIQVTSFDPVTAQAYISNAGKAVSKGIEGAIRALPTEGLTIMANASYNDAYLDRALPAGGGSYGVPGDELPNAPRFTGSLTVEQEFPLTAMFTGFVAGSASHVGERRGAFVATASQYRVVLPSYDTFDLRAGMRNDEWTVSVYMRNLTDEKGVLYGQSRASASITTSPFYSILIQPRTFGLSASRNF